MKCPLISFHRLSKLILIADAMWPFCNGSLESQYSSSILSVSFVLCLQPAATSQMVKSSTSPGRFLLYCVNASSEEENRCLLFPSLKYCPLRSVETVTGTGKISFPSGFALACDLIQMAVSAIVLPLLSALGCLMLLWRVEGDETECWAFIGFSIDDCV